MESSTPIVYDFFDDLEAPAISRFQLMRMVEKRIITTAGMNWVLKTYNL